MAQVFNLWKDPPTTNTLTGDLASFEINDQEGPQEPGDSAAEDATEMSGHGDAMSQALQVISQQAGLISKLMAMLGK